MAHIVIMPRQGNTVESCIIVGWNKKEGDQVQENTPLCDVETDKATFEVAAGAEGTLLKILHQAGDDVPVLQPIAVIGKEGEDWQSMLGESGSIKADSIEEDSLQASSEETGAVESSVESSRERATPSPVEFEADLSGSAPASPRARNLAARAALDLSALAGTGPGGRIIERDVQGVLQSQPPMTVAARAALSDTGIGAAISKAPSGIGGRLRAADLEKVSTTQEQTETKGTGLGSINGSEERIETPIRGVRKLISDRMHESLSSTAQFTLNSHAPSVRLLELRQRFKESNPELGLSAITINDLILFVVSRLLPLYPFMNAHKENDRLITYRRVHLGMAVDTPRGLMVPVIRNADQLNLAQISTEAKRLATACQEGNINPDELTGSTFTVTNLGALGIESFTPVINIPEVAILGVCGMELKPLPNEGSLRSVVDPSEIRFVPHIGLSLTINHQVVDGAPAARFLKALCDSISQIDLWLAR